MSGKRGTDPSGSKAIVKETLQNGELTEALDPSSLSLSSFKKPSLVSKIHDP